ncbi:MAG: hypothetical protein WC175_05095 [Candidatus Dojkabacteria bacterium]
MWHLKCADSQKLDKLYLSDAELFSILKPHAEEYEIKKLASAISMALSNNTTGVGTENGRR